MHKFFLFLFVIIVAAYFAVSNRTAKSPLFPTPTPITQNNSTPVEIKFNGQVYHIYMEKIEEPNNVQLIPNFSEQKSGSDVTKEYTCQTLTSGQFYTSDNKPLGYLQIKYNIINSNIHNPGFFNGFVVSQNGQLDITEELSDAELIGFAFQAGPLFTPKTKLTISADEPARRILLGETDTGYFYFLAITEKGNSYGGPLLSDLPVILNKFNSGQFLNLNSKFLTLINLDGGTASVFINDSTSLSELAPVGSFLCEI